MYVDSTRVSLAEAVGVVVSLAAYLNSTELIVVAHLRLAFPLYAHAIKAPIVALNAHWSMLTGCSSCALQLRNRFGAGATGVFALAKRVGLDVAEENSMAVSVVFLGQREEIARQKCKG